MSMKAKTKVRTGGYSNYSIRSATMIENYVPGPMRQNFLLDPDLALGKYDPGTFWADDLIQNGPGSLQQALPDASRFQYDRIFAVPRGNPYKNIGVDDRQIASYQVEQLHTNPLSQYTTEPDKPIPSFFTMSEPDNFSTMVNKRESEFKEYANDTYGPKDWLQGTTGGENVYPQYSGDMVNANAAVVYNMSLNSTEEVNPMISLGSSSRARSSPNFSGLAYSGKFVPGQIISDQGGNNPPAVYRGSHTEPNFEGAAGFMNPNAYKNPSICVPDRSLNFANPLILNSIN
jgi:hypothetical protein